MYTYRHRCCSSQTKAQALRTPDLTAQAQNDAAVPVGDVALATFQYACFSQVVGSTAVAAACLARGVENPAALDAGTTATYVISADILNLFIASHVIKSTLQRAGLHHPVAYLQQAQQAMSSRAAAWLLGGAAACTAASYLTTQLGAELQRSAAQPSTALDAASTAAAAAVGAASATEPGSALEAAVSVAADPSTGAFRVLAASLLLVGPLSEELVFRGLLTGSLSRHWSRPQPQAGAAACRSADGDGAAAGISDGTSPPSASRPSDDHLTQPPSSPAAPASPPPPSSSSTSDAVPKGRAAAVAVGALVFAAYHLDADNFLALALVGCVLGGVYEATGRNLLAAWGAHALYNAAVLAAQQLP